VRLSEGNSADLIKRVINRQEDLAVVARARYNPALRAIPFASCEFVLVGRPDHPLALQGVVPISALRSESMIIRERGSGSRKAILAKLQQFGVTPSVLVESESLSFILAYIERRKGLAFMLSHEITEELAAGALRQITLQEGTIGFESDIVIRKDGPISEPMKYFLKIANGQMV
jgi:DNA-binding transcriptional LysR family regulator